MAVLQINGQPFGTLTMSRIISVQLADNRGFEADELTIELSDHDGALEIPPQEALIKCWLGYQETGVVYKGEYKMAEFTHSGAPDKLSITARAADLAATLDRAIAGHHDTPPAPTGGDVALNSPSLEQSVAAALGATVHTPHHD